MKTKIKLDKDLACKDRVASHLTNRMVDLRMLWDAYQDGNEDGVENLGNIYEYGLSFDYVAPGTFGDQKRGYFRYQLSWGGPSDEFRFYCDESMRPVKIEYWFTDWNDGAKKTLTGKRLELLMELWEWFKDSGTTEKVYNDAMRG